MAASQEPHLGLFYGWSVADNYKTQMDQNWQMIGAAIQLAALSNALTDPPVSPTVGDRYLIPAAGATGDWAGKENQIATWDSAAWLFLVPRAGWRIDVAAPTVQYLRWTGAAWTNIGGEANTASNVGAGDGLFSSKVGDDLQFKTLQEGTSDITFSVSPTEIAIHVRGIAAMASGLDVGSFPILGDIVGGVRVIKALIAGANMTITPVGDSLELASTGGGGGGVANIGEVVDAILTDGSGILLGADGSVLYAGAPPAP